MFLEICRTVFLATSEILTAPTEAARRRSAASRARASRVAAERRKALYNLRRAGLITKKENAASRVQLTSRGTAYALLRCLRNKKKMLSKGILCVVIFDIPETSRDERDSLRFLLRQLGFKSWQKSVWVSQQDAAEHLQYFIQLRKLDNWVKVLTAMPAKRRGKFTIVK